MAVEEGAWPSRPTEARVLTADWGGFLVLWDVITGREIRRFQLPTGLGSIKSVAYLPEGARVSTSGNTTILWDLEKDQEVRRFPVSGGPQFSPYEVTSKDGSHVLSIRYPNGAYGGAWLRDTREGGQPRELVGKIIPVTAVLARNHELIVMGNYNREDVIERNWDLDRGKLSNRGQFYGHKGFVVPRFQVYPGHEGMHSIGLRDAEVSSHEAILELWAISRRRVQG